MATWDESQCGKEGDAALNRSCVPFPSAILIEAFGGTAQVVGTGSAYFTMFEGTPTTEGANAHAPLVAHAKVRRVSNGTTLMSLSDGWSNFTYDVYARYGQLFTTQKPTAEFLNGDQY